jgi:hypothetical protein
MSPALVRAGGGTHTTDHIMRAMAPTGTASVILKNRALLAPELQRAMSWAVALVFAALLAGSAFMLHLSGQSVDPSAVRELIERALDLLCERPLEFATLVGGLVLSPLPALYVARARRDERLVITAQDLEYVSPLPRALQFLQPAWTVRWTQVHRASLAPSRMAPGPQFMQLVLELGLERRRLMPYVWVDPQTYRPPNPRDPREARRRMQRDAVIAELRASPLLAAVARHAPQFAVDWDAVGPGQFALEKNPWTLGAVVVFFALFGYALLDGLFLNLETYALPPGYGGSAAAGGAAALAVFGLLRRARVPSGESAALAALIGAALGAALYPGLLRINQLTDVQGLQVHAYEHRGGGYFVPRASGPPPLDLSRYGEYWTLRRPGTGYEFELRRGGLGFYQLNLAPLYAVMREHYSGRRSR